MSVANSNGAILGVTAIGAGSMLAATGSSIIETLTLFLVGVLSLFIFFTGIETIKNKLQMTKLKRK